MDSEIDFSSANSYITGIIALSYKAFYIPVLDHNFCIVALPEFSVLKQLLKHALIIFGNVPEERLQNLL